MGLPEILVVAGEASGDRLAAGLLGELRKLRPEVRAFGMGGPLLEAAGADLLYGAAEVAVMGIAEVLPKLRRLRRVMAGLAQAATRRRPCCAVLVDIPDF